MFSGSSCDHVGYTSSTDVERTVWDLIPEYKTALYPHQRDGFEFIWKSIAGDIKIDELDKPVAVGLDGCMVHFPPGTGKKCLAVVFLRSYMKQYPMAKPVIFAPPSKLITWEEEFNRWNNDIPFHNLRDNELSGKEDPEILSQEKETTDCNRIRLIKLCTWASGNSVLGVSFRLFQRLVKEGDGTMEKARKILLRKPNILVLDEGYGEGNCDDILRITSQIPSKKCVIFSGTRFRYNLEELQDPTGFVVEEAAGALALPEQWEQEQGKFKESGKRIEPFVYIHHREELSNSAKELFYSIVILKQSNLQKTCFEHFKLSSDVLVSVTAVHPSILTDQKMVTKDKPYVGLLNTHKMNFDAAPKIRFLVELIKMSRGERVVVFVQYLYSLNFITDLLKSVFSWTIGSQLLYMSGNEDLKVRQYVIRLFNDPTSEARVLLASAKVYEEGIHLVGASRVVLLDVLWCPFVQRQAISTVFRIGQQKDMFIYHLITSGTQEEKIYLEQAVKYPEHCVDPSFDESMLTKNTRSRITDYRVLSQMILHEKMQRMFKKIICLEG